jgi:hypothetical protein
MYCVPQSMNDERMKGKKEESQPQIKKHFKMKFDRQTTRGKS